MFEKKTEEITTSPLPVKESEVSKKEVNDIGDFTPVREMDFPEAIKAVISGKKIFRLEWVDKAYYGYLNGEILSLHKPDGESYKWIISQGDLEGTDWIVI